MSMFGWGRSFIVAITGVLLVACGGDNGNEDSPLLGAWITEACEQKTDASGNSLDAWIRGLFEFTRDGRLLTRQREYTDSNCQVLAGTQPASGQGSDILFEDLGETTLPDGLEGAGLRISLDGALLGSSSEGSYIIMQRQACFSYAFRFRPTGLGLSSDSADINYLDCLQRL